MSLRAERPEATFRCSECHARGVSVLDCLAACERALKLPRLRGRRVCSVRLDNGAGYIQQTFQPSHHTWWPLADWDILAHCGEPQP